MNKLRIQFLGIILLGLSHTGITQAAHIVGPTGSCPTGFTRVPLGNGEAINDVFFPGSGSNLPHFRCDPPVVHDEIDVGLTSSQRARTRSEAHQTQLFTSFLGMSCSSVSSSETENCFNNQTPGDTTSSLGIKGASSDSNNLLPDSFWGVSSITEISEDTSSHRDTDIYHFIGGTDIVIGDFIVGGSLTYAHTEDEQGRVQSTADTIGITPYLAYKFTDYLFASTLMSYDYTHINSVGGRSDLDENDFITETNLNLFKVIDSFILKGRAGLRYKHTHTMLEKDFNGRDDDFDELTWLADVEVGYYFPNKVHIFTGFLYEYYDREASASSTLVHDGTGFMRYGVEYPVYKALNLSAKIEHDINDEDNDFITGTINARLDF